jgi:hypothetical protein
VKGAPEDPTAPEKDDLDDVTQEWNGPVSMALDDWVDLQLRAAPELDPMRRRIISMLLGCDLEN